MKHITITFKNGMVFRDRIDNVEYEPISHTIQCKKNLEMYGYVYTKNIIFNSSDIVRIFMNGDAYSNILTTINKCCENCAYRDVPTRFNPCKCCLESADAINSHPAFLDRWSE